MTDSSAQMNSQMLSSTGYVDGDAEDEPTEKDPVEELRSCACPH